jgi:creatinine amidohydrolase
MTRKEQEMLSRYEPVCYELLRPGEVRALREATPIAYIPAGSLEWHSFQNPLGTDALKAHAVCCEAALRHGGVVLPPFYQGLVGDHNWGPEEWEGYTLGYNQPDMLENAMLGTARALVLAGWKVLVGVTGHDVEPQRAAMERAITQAVRDTDVQGFAVLEGALQQPEDDLPVSMDHAGAWETSCMMHACPGRVDLDTLRERELSDPEQMKMSGPEGIGGKNPLKYASPELGTQIIEKMGDRIGAKARGLLEG